MKGVQDARARSEPLTAVYANQFPAFATDNTETKVPERETVAKNSHLLTSQIELGKLTTNTIPHSPFLQPNDDRK